MKRPLPIILIIILILVIFSLSRVVTRNAPDAGQPAAQVDQPAAQPTQPPAATDAPTATPAPTQPPPTPSPIPPTATPAPPTETPTPAATLTTEQRIETAIAGVLSNSNRDVDRIQEVSYIIDTINIKWSINDNLTDSMLKSGARLDIAKMLEATSQAGVDYELINFEGTFSLIDQLGNAQETTVVWATYDRATVDQINWPNFLTDNVYNIATTSKRHPAFEE